MDLSGRTNLTSIGSAFARCTSLDSVDLSGCTNLTSIGTFYNCSSLTSVNFSGCSSLTSIKEETFYDCSSLASVNFSGCSSLTSIKRHAFYSCSRLTSMDLSYCTGLTEIGHHAFYNCSGLASIDLSLCVDLYEIGYNAFEKCSNLSSLRLPDNLREIDSSAFSGCTKLTYLELPKRIKTLYLYSSALNFGDTVSRTVKIPAASQAAFDRISGNVYPYGTDTTYTTFVYDSGSPEIDTTIEESSGTYTAYFHIYFPYENDTISYIKKPDGDHLYLGAEYYDFYTKDFGIGYTIQGGGNYTVTVKTSGGTEKSVNFYIGTPKIIAADTSVLCTSVAAMTEADILKAVGASVDTTVDEFGTRTPKLSISAADVSKIQSLQKGNSQRITIQAAPTWEGGPGDTKEVVITALDLPILTGTLSIPTTGKSGDVITATATDTGLTEEELAKATYEWQKNGKTITGATGKTYTLTKSDEDSNIVCFMRIRSLRNGMLSSNVMKVEKSSVTTYTVTFHANGHGTDPTARTGVTSGLTIPAPTAPTASGYTFEGWYKESGCINPWNFASDTVTGNTDLYAKWISNAPATEYTVTFHANGHGTDPTAWTGVTSGSTIPAPTDPTASGYTFEGWYKESGCIHQWNFASDTVTGNTDLYARWTQNVTSTPDPTPTPSDGGGDRGSISYSIRVSQSDNGTARSNLTFAGEGRAITITVTPADGYVPDVLTVTDANGKEIALTKKSDTSYTFTMPASNVTVSAAFRAQETDSGSATPFVDVEESDFFCNAVQWAVTNGITNGVDATHFAPCDITTRAQMVTFLWRAAGSPEPTAAVNPFTDVTEDDYFYKAVLWGYENIYVKGTSPTEFSPDLTVTRGQAVTFLARMAGVTDEATGYVHDFMDVPVDTYYNNAIAWASQKGIARGTGENRFSPDQGCKRGEVVTFLYRNATL